MLCALLAATVLVGLPSPSGATNLATLNLSSTAGKAGESVSVQLSLSSDQTGVGHLRGLVVVDGQRLMAQNTDALSRWADLDDDGVAGVTFISGTVVSRELRAPIEITITPVGDIDEPGAYEIDLTIDGQTFRIDVRAAFSLRRA